MLESAYLRKPTRVINDIEILFTVIEITEEQAYTVDHLITY